MAIFTSTEFRFNRALLNLGSLKSISDKSGVPLSRINRVLKSNDEIFTIEEAADLGKMFNKIYAHRIECNHSCVLSNFYPILQDMRLEKYGTRRISDDDMKNIKIAFLNLVNLYEKKKWLKKRYLDDLRALLDDYLNERSGRK